ncbi:hypothetical protein EON62_00735 [archaeon]|nr:MAG: hypothetical protein EON62_00735 [archaeon]
MQNIRKILIFVMPTNFVQGLSIFFAIVIGMDFPLTPMQVLWVNMATSVTLGMVLALGTCSVCTRLPPSPMPLPTLVVHSFVVAC